MITTAPQQDSSVPRPGQPWWTQKTKPALPQPVAKARYSPDEFYQAQLDWRSLQLQQVLDKRQAAEDAADAAVNRRRSRAPPNGASPAAGPPSARAAWSEDCASKTRASEPRPASARTPEAGKRTTVRGPVTPGAEPGSVDRVVVDDHLDAGALAADHQHDSQHPDQHAFERLYDESAERRERRDATHAEAERLREERESAGCTFAPRRAAPPPSSVSPRVAALAAQGAAALAGRLPADYSESFYQAQLEWRRAQLQRAADKRQAAEEAEVPPIPLPNPNPNPNPNPIPNLNPNLNPSPSPSPSPSPNPKPKPKPKPPTLSLTPGGGQRGGLGRALGLVVGPARARGQEEQHGGQAEEQRHA